MKQITYQERSTQLLSSQWKRLVLSFVSEQLLLATFYSRLNLRSEINCYSEGEKELSESCLNFAYLCSTNDSSAVWSNSLDISFQAHFRIRT